MGLSAHTTTAKVQKLSSRCETSKLQRQKKRNIETCCGRPSLSASSFWFYIYIRFPPSLVAEEEAGEGPPGRPDPPRHRGHPLLQGAGSPDQVPPPGPQVPRLGLQDLPVLLDLELLELVAGVCSRRPGEIVGLLPLHQGRARSRLLSQSWREPAITGRRQNMARPFRTLQSLTDI